MPLHLIPVFFNAAEEIASAVHIQHDSVALAAHSLPLIIVCSHLDPFCLQRTVVTAPLPPLPATHLLYTIFAEIRDDGICGFRNKLWRYGYVFGTYPRRMGDDVGSEGLEVVHGLGRGIREERADQMEPFIIRDVGCRLLVAGLPVCILNAC